MGQTKNFFQKKKSWSIVKDKILGYYLVPYLVKIRLTRKPVVIIDCFAGKGNFDDGEKGSPLIIAEHIKNVVLKDPSFDIQSIFIEKKYHDELKANLDSYRNVKIYHGLFEDKLQTILSFDKNSNVFLYVDPYGIKSLNLTLFAQIKNKQFSSLEMLMNFNSIGFLREGCRLLAMEKAVLTEDNEVIDYEVEDTNNIDNMNTIAGGDYWQNILHDFYDTQNCISFYEAEERFFSEYSCKAKQLFKYTVNIPIKDKLTHLPKYRLIFATNHEDGLILMADNMNKKWKEIILNQEKFRPAIPAFEFPDLTLPGDIDLHKDILSLVSDNGILLKSLIVKLFQKHGITFSVSDYTKEVHRMEKNSELIVERIPSLTPKTKKPSISMNYDKCKITVRKKL